MDLIVDWSNHLEVSTEELFDQIYGWQQLEGPSFLKEWDDTYNEAKWWMELGGWNMSRGCPADIGIFPSAIATRGLAF